jgi:hypothetical protein
MERETEQAQELLQGAEQDVSRELAMVRSAADAVQRALELGLWVQAQAQSKVLQAQGVLVVLAVHAWVACSVRAAESEARELAAVAPGRAVARLERACQGAAESARESDDAAESDASAE